MKKFLFLLIFSSISTYAQEIEGYVYDAEGRVSRVRIHNLSQDLFEVSNPYGYFRVEAAVGDTVHFSYVAYDLYELIVQKQDLEKKIVVELKFSTLDEVKITGYRSRNTAVEDLDDELASQIQKDIKKHPNYYRTSKGNIGNIIQSVVDLFKRDQTLEPADPEPEFISVEDFEVLFLRDDFFDEEFLSQELGIPKENHKLFYEFLALQQLEYYYLEKLNKLDLIEKLYNYSEKYMDWWNSTKSKNN
ncbi:hypothetical protein [Psychroflexus sediminis]|uniref:CarboxypepD_reg-like domain-containing protein n=1 Tax=Psychroflexus sediminis TaxID=470826 RepID=A0A1G7UNA7_9FLAO|nr:hypothetical protein [Psychroflexus sediminis]SDG48220.1 hypothetical protein SAMN04488027_102142 [Psychroflexus sediminis]